MIGRQSIVVMMCLVAACAGESGVAQPERWTSETLQPGMIISFPQGYEGDGYRCGIDACYFNKSRADSAIKFNFPVSGMTGYTPARFDELPGEYMYPHRELIETESGLSSALYFVLEDEHEFPQSFGVLLIEEHDGSGFREVVWVTFDAVELNRTKDILRSIDYE